MWTLACGGAIFLVALILAVGLRERRSWTDQAKLWDGRTISVHQKYSNWRYFGLPHQGGIGGHDPNHELSVDDHGHRFRWRGPYTPILIQEDRGRWYLAVFDRETDFSQVRFRYYELTNDEKYVEIAAKDFPKHLAIQNLWLMHNNGSVNGKPVDEFDIVDRLDPADPLFRRSLTPMMWCHLEYGVEYYESSRRDQSQEVIEKYKKRYIRK